MREKPEFMPATHTRAGEISNEYLKGHLEFGAYISDLVGNGKGEKGHLWE